MALKIYVASSWRNELQPAVVKALRADGHEVYDFKNPRTGDYGFSWQQVGLNDTKNIQEYYKAMDHPRAVEGYTLDYQALNWCDTCILLLPCGRSAHLEAGYAVGRGKDVFIFLSKYEFEPELMYKMCQGMTHDLNTLFHWCNKKSISNAS